MSDLIGRTVSHYEILDRLGSGAMATVYKAQDLKLGRTVALKFLSPELTLDQAAKARFLNEARITSSLQHRNICVVYDVEDIEGLPMFISMECLDGVTLKTRLGTAPFTIAEALKTATQITSGLAHAHASGIVHRDLKPANIMIAPDGSAKILDFGLAKALSGNISGDTGNWQGTVSYMSPEQARGESVDERTDVWALGVLLYEMVAGRRPFENEYSQAILYAIVHERQQSPRRVRPDIPPALERVIERCLAKSREERYRNAGALLEAIKGAGLEVKGAKEAAPKAIAVLPFTDIGPDTENSYFSEGLTEEIITKLSHLEKVRIVSRGSVMHYDRSGKSTRQIAAELNVQYLLEGSVRQFGSQLRITTQLVDANQDAYLWAETYNGTLDQIFDIQEDVADRVVKALKVRLSPADRKSLKSRATDNTGAYQLYLKGRYFWSNRTKESLLTAIKYFEEAIANDPRYAPAWAGIADSYLLLTDYIDLPRREIYAKVQEAVSKALEIDDQLAEAHTSLGLLAMLDGWKWEIAEKEFRLAIAASPNYATAHHWYAECLSYTGRLEDALTEIFRAVELDPLSPAAMKDQGLIQYYARDFDGAIESARKAIELSPDFPSAHRLLSLAYQAKGLYIEALAEHELWAEQANLGCEEQAARAQFYAIVGREEEARALIARCPQKGTAGGNVSRGVALAYIALGDFDEAFSWFDRAVEEGAESLGTLHVDPKVDPLRSDPRFAVLLGKIGLTG